MHRSVSLVALAAGILLTSCQPGLSDKDIVGTWSGTLTAAEIAPANMPDQVKTMLAGQTIDYNVTFKEDKTWSVPISIGSFFNTTLSGTWELKEGKIETVTTTAGGETTLWTVAGDKKTLSGTIRNAPITLTKAP